MTKHTELIARLRAPNGSLGNEAATCTRHQGWLDVVQEWADRAKAAEAQLAAAKKQEPCAHQFQTVDGGWHPFLDDKHYQNTKEDGRWPIRAFVEDTPNDYKRIYAAMPNDYKRIYAAMPNDYKRIYAAMLAAAPQPKDMK